MVILPQCEVKDVFFLKVTPVRIDVHQTLPGCNIANPLQLLGLLLASATSEFGFRMQNENIIGSPRACGILVRCLQRAELKKNRRAEKRGVNAFTRVITNGHDCDCLKPQGKLKTVTFEGEAEA